MHRLLALIFTFFMLSGIAVAGNGINQKPETTKGDSTNFLPEEYFIDKAFKYVQNPKRGFITADNKVSFGLHEVGRGSAGTATVKLQHLVDDIPVKYSILFIHYKWDGKMYGTGGNFYEVPADLNTSPAINKEQAEKIAIAALPPPLIEDMPPVEIVKSELLIDKIKDEFKLIWYIATGYGPYHADCQEFEIDAHTGNILIQRSELIY